MLITPALLHVKTQTGRGRRDPATRLKPRGAGEGFALDGLTAEDVLARLDVPVIARGPEKTEWDCIRADHAAMADAGEWDDLLEALRFAEAERTMASGGRRVAPLISEGARSRLTAAITAGALDEAAEELRRFEAVLALHADDPGAAHLLAQALIDVGTWASRQAGADPDGQGRAAAVEHFVRAEAVLADFDPIEEMSPLLAATRYGLIGGLEDARALARDWYEDWCDLDPEDVRAHAAHAVTLLPAQGGSAAVFEKAARKAAALTGQITGRAAYAVFHMTAHDHLGQALPSLDLEMLAQGLMDYQAATGCQHRANRAANLLTELLSAYRLAGPAATWQVSKARAALSEVLWNRLREVHLDIWTHGADSLAFALAEVFGPALRKGGRIQHAGSGLGARVPRANPVG